MKSLSAKHCEKTLKALANRRRLEIVIYLLNHRGANVGDLASHLKLSFKATSKHLAVLLGADIVTREQKGVFSSYSLAPSLPSVAQKVISVL